MEKSKPDKPAKKRRRRGWVIGLIVLALVAFVWFLPLIVANTSLRDTAINAALSKQEMSGSTDSASLSWIAPVRFNGVGLRSADERLKVDVDRIETKKTLVGLISSPADLGTIEIDRPQVTVELPESLELSPPESAGGPGKTFNAVIHNAKVTVHSPMLSQPLIELDGMDLDMGIERNGDGRDMVIAPVKIFDHQELTQELCDQGLQLVTPILADVANIEGAVTLDLKTFRLPIGGMADERARRRADIEGVVQLNHVTAQLENPILQGLMKSIEALLKRDIPTTLRVADNSEVKFHMRDGRVHHEGLAFFLPELSSEITFHTSGSVGLDETLDLDVEFRLPLSLIADGPLVKAISRQLIKVPVTGTIDKPKLGLPSLGSIVAGSEGGGRPLASDEEKEQLAAEIARAGVKIIGQIVESRRNKVEAGEKRPGLGLFRDRRNDADESSSSSEEESKPKRRGLLKRLLNR